ncbi:hypothetical protein GALMADRAFT_272715 [Galerina marginata CBS 339.88]|uniref:Uncharacterized protein n=1 Tax=Galerina marginata (strain CBS 339.88) TaxID=685588 RepID=A0A067SBL7_GALM3|nr:hypothetical protein GALMADRAFT_272715 [Galerina marginata CBS 339.88]
MEDTSSAPIHLGSNSPVSYLDDDVLLYIFKINAHLPGEYRTAGPHPLIVTRMTSQVCRRWRALVVDSPSIWASLIDIDLLNTTTEDWSDEVMRRTGSSLLSVKGNILLPLKTSRSLLSDLLANHWSRIQEFTMWIAPDALDSSLLDIFWDKPAPNLEKFSLGYNYSFVMRLEHSKQRRTLFLGHAPLLRFFHCKILDFDIHRASWISQLRILTLSSPLNFVDVLDVLSRTPHLESLVIDSDVASAPTPPSCRHNEIVLPHLHYIQIESLLRNSLILLERIVLSLACDLYLVTKDYDPRKFNGADFTSIHPVISRYVESYFNSTNVVDFTIAMTGASFIVFPFTRDKTIGRVGMVPPFGLNITCYPALPPESTALLLSTFSARQLASVTTLDLLSNGTCDLSPADPMFIGLILSFVAVETLTVSESSIELLNALSLDNALVFPGVKTVKLKYLTEATLKFDETIVLFLSRRKDAGVPVHEFDISNWTSKEAINWDFLDEVRGLRVVWKANDIFYEHVCGSGGSERLNLLV